MRVERLSQRAVRRWTRYLLFRHAWKVAFALVFFLLLTSRSATGPLNYSTRLGQHPLGAAVSTGPTVVSCTALLTGTTTWDGRGSPYILPWSDPSIPVTDTTREPNCTATDSTGKLIAADVQVGAGATLTIDGSFGPVQIFSHGAGITVAGGQIDTTNTTATNFVTFDASPDAASWNGLSITTGLDSSSQLHRGTGVLAFTSIQHALTGIKIDSGATTLPDGYGLTFSNGAVGPSYFDGIDSTNTPLQLTGQNDGQYGTLNNIGSQGVKVTFDPSLPNYPASIGHPLYMHGMVFGSSVPFGQTLCLPEQPCAAGTIGNDAVFGTFTGQPNVFISWNSFFRAGSFGIDLESADRPQVTNNLFTCNGSGSPTPVTSCAPSGSLPTFSAMYLNNVTMTLPVDTGSCPPPPPPAPASSPPDPIASGVSNNCGQQNGLDALVMSGTVNGNVIWKTPTNDANGPAIDSPHRLGFMVANIAGNGALQLTGGNLTVNPGDVVKVKGGSIILNGGSLLAADPNSTVKTFTSMRDNTVGIQACPSIFVQSCPPVLPSSSSPGLPGGEWAGVDLVGATANIRNANILFATKAVDISPAGGVIPTLFPGRTAGSYGLVMLDSHVGPTFSDSLSITGISADIEGTFFCRVDTAPKLADGTTANANLGNCLKTPPSPLGTDAGPGARGINADFSGASAGGSGLVLKLNEFRGSANEAILGTSLKGRPVDVESNSVMRAGTYGMQLAGADQLTLWNNRVSSSGTGTVQAPTTYPAIYLNQVDKAQFLTGSGTPPATACSQCIEYNSGFGNGLDAIAFHGSTLGNLAWITASNSGTAPVPLGYLLDDSLTVNPNGTQTGDLTLNPADVVPVRQGSITVSGKLNANSALVTSVKEHIPNLPTCGSIFDVPASTSSGPVCAAPGAGDWGGFVLNPPQQSRLSNTTIQDAATAVSASGPLYVSGGQIARTTAEGILDTGLTTTTQVILQNLAIDHAGTYGIHLSPSASSSLSGGMVRVVANTVTNSGTGAPTYPAIALGLVTSGNFLPPTDSVCAPDVTKFCVQGNAGGGNGVNALVFHGTMSNDLTWITAANAAVPSPKPLGYLLDSDLNMGGHQLIVNAGDIVKVAPSAAIDMAGGRLNGDDTSTASQKVFTSLADSTIGVNACGSVLPATCGAGAASYWSGLLLDGAGANGSLVNTAIRNASTAINITSGATSTSSSSTFGLVVSHSAIGPTSLDGIDTTGTPISVTNSTVSNALHGISADLTANSPVLFVTGNRFTTMGAEAILGQGLAGRPVWISDNRISNATTFGIRLVGANELVLRNNNITGTGTGASPYPAVYLPGVTADFVNNIRGNVGQGNGINGIVLDGTVTSDLAWLTPDNNAITLTHPLGYMLDGPLTLNAGTLTVPANASIKALGGAITINGGRIMATSGAQATFSSVKDPTGPYQSCPSFFAALPCAPAAGDWGGIVVTAAGSGGTIDSALINFADTAISTDSGGSAAPNLHVTKTTIINTHKDGISASDTPIDVENSYIGTTAAPSSSPYVDPSLANPNIGGYGIVASFFSAPSCGTTCARVTLLGNRVADTGKAGIALSGLGGQKVDAETNTVANAKTYGLILAGADQLTLTGNTVASVGSPGSNPSYPAIYLNAVKADFQTLVTSGQVVQGNHGWGNGLDAIVFHGEAINNLGWLTAAAAPLKADDQRLGYLLDGPLTVDGTFSTAANDVVKILNGGIKINPLNGLGGVLNAVGSTYFTSLKDHDAAHGLNACQSILITGSCTPGPTDWTGISIDAGNSLFTNSTLLYASSGISISDPSAGAALLHLTGATVAGINGVALSTSGSAKLLVDCSSIRRNGTGIQSNNATVNDSDVYGNGTDLNGGPNLIANSDDFLGTTTNPPVIGGTPTYTNIGTQQPAVTALNLGSDNPLATPDKFGDPAYGQGNLKLSATAFSRKMSVATAPSATFGLGDRSTGTITGSPHTFDVTSLANNGYANDGVHWTPNPYFVANPPIDAGYSVLRLTNARGCVPPEIDGPMPNANSNLLTPAFQGFSASLLPTVLTPSPASGFYGGTASLSATLTANGGTPSPEPITFQVPGQSAIVANTVAGTATVPAAPLGNLGANQPHSYQVSFPGDPDQFFTPAPSATGSPITATLTINRAGTTTGLVNTTGNPTSTYGDTVTWTATVSTQVSGGLQPSGEGSVTFMDGVTTLCSNVALGAGTNTASCTRNDLGAGAHSISAAYNPASLTPNFTTSTSSSLGQTVNTETPMVTTASSPGGGLGTYLTESVTVTGGPVVGGSVTFQLFAPGDTTCASNVVAANTAFSNVALTNGAAASPAFQATSSGDYHWIVDYNADANHNSVTPSLCGDKVTITTDLATTTTLSSAPTDVTTSLSSVTLRAVVTPSWNTQPLPTAGTVAFAAGGTSITCGSWSTTGLALTTTSNTVNCVTDYTTINGKQLTATYSGATSGGNTYDASSGSLASSTTTVASSAQGSITSGQSVTFTATINPSSAPGTVEFFDGSSAIVGCTSQTVSAGTASCTTTSLTGAGTTHTVTAIYSTGSTYETSEGTVSQAISP